MTNTLSRIQEYWTANASFHARLADDIAVVVKFARHYGEAAHRKAHDLGIAPTLISLAHVYDWYLSVMEGVNYSEKALCTISGVSIP